MSGGKEGRRRAGAGGEGGGGPSEKGRSGQYQEIPHYVCKLGRGAYNNICGGSVRSDNAAIDLLVALFYWAAYCGSVGEGCGSGSGSGSGVGLGTSYYIRALQYMHTPSILRSYAYELDYSRVRRTRVGIIIIITRIIYLYNTSYESSSNNNTTTRTRVREY